MHRIRGASDYLNWCDVTVALERQSPPQAIDAVLKVSVLKTRALKEPAPFLIERSSSTFLHRRIEDAALCSAARLVTILGETFGGQCDKAQELVAKAVELTGCSERTAKDALKAAKAGGSIEAKPDPDDKRVQHLGLPEIEISAKVQAAPNPLHLSNNLFT
jgi:hypothetical protein